MASFGRLRLPKPCKASAGGIDLLTMTARGDIRPEVDARAVEVERIADSPALHGSESLRRLLRYLASRAIHEPRRSHPGA